MLTIDLNADLGEGMGDDQAMLAIVSSANIACGGHAGDAASMLAACEQAQRNGVVVGAHVSYPDRAHFGRVDLDMSGASLLASLQGQVEELMRAAERAGTRVRYLKPHGALYHRVSHDADQADVVVQLARTAGLAVMGLPGALVLVKAAEAGVGTVVEAFADRGYLPDGALVPRGAPGDVLHDPQVVAQRMVGLARTGMVTANDGSALRVAAQSICVHSDTPGAVAIATAVRDRLLAAGVRIEAVL